MQRKPWSRCADMASLHPSLLPKASLSQQKEKEKKEEKAKEEATKAETKAVAAVALTPMLRQFLDLKQKHPDALLLFRTGDFYET